MSRVTGFTLVTSCCEDEADTDMVINQWLQEKDDRWRIKNTAEHGGGSKHSQLHVFVGGFNHFTWGNRVDLFLFLETLKWELPKSVIAIIEHEEDEENGFHIWRPK